MAAQVPGAGCSVDDGEKQSHGPRPQDAAT